MTSIKARLNRSRIGKDGKYALVIQVLHGRMKRVIATPYRLISAEFDNFSEKAFTDRRNRTRAAEISEINACLMTMKQEIAKVVLSLADQVEFSVVDIATTYKTGNDMSNLFVYADCKIAEMKAAGRNSTSGNYRSAVNAFERFVGNRNFYFDQLTKSMLEDFMDFLKQQGNKPNTVVFYIRQLRALYNKADDDGYVCTESNPFAKLKLKGAETAKRAISKQEVGKIVELDLEDQHEDIELARDLFLFSLFTRGMSFIDMCYLRKSDIHGNMLVYRRRKTGQQLQVKIEPALQALLNKYRDVDSDYLLPMLRKDDSYNRYRYMQRCLNKRISELGTQLGFNFPLTFYVARHTWATMARDKGFPISAISTGMGHTSEQTTRIYLANLNHHIIDKMNKAGINSWMRKNE